MNTENHQVTSDPDDEYNCIAYAADDTTRSWWPRPEIPSGWKIPRYCYWPDGCSEAETVSAFVEAFESIGYECKEGDDETLEDGFEKIAIYALEVGGIDVPQHAAKQSPFRNGKWRSKMGDDEDIEHELAALVGPLYGRVVKIMRQELSVSVVRKKLKNKKKNPNTTS